MKLTQKFCESAPKGIYWDSQLPGFGLRVHVKTRSYVLFIRDKNKQKRQTIIGHVGDLPLNDARERARALKEKKPEARQRIDIKEACSLYMREWSEQRKRSHKKDQQRIDRLILPALGNRPLDDVSPLDVVRWHQAIKAPYEANRALELLSSIYSYHLKMCRVSCPNPCRAAVPNREEPRDRYLTMPEIKRIISALDSVPLSPRVALLLLIYTGRRVNEILTLEWCDVVLDEHSPHIVIQPEKCKQRKRIFVPLSPPALAAISLLPKVSKWVFPRDDDPTQHRFQIKVWWSKTLKTAQVENARLHDLRRSVPSALAQVGRTALETANAIGDSVQTTARHYAICGLDSKRELLEQYAGLLQ